MAQLQRKFICTSGSDRYTPSSCRWAEIDDRGWVDGKTPIEDFGMFLVLDQEISSRSADRLFLALLGHAEGEEPEVRDEEVYRSAHEPQLLTPEEFTIYQNLINQRTYYDVRTRQETV